jgi:hypothetical protein
MAATLCPHCGTPNRTGSNFCNRCGADLRGETPPATDISGAAAPESLGAAAPETASPTEQTQPWLAPGFLGADDAPFEEDEEELAVLDTLSPLPTPAARLVSGVQGLLDPIRVAAMPQDETLVGGVTGAPELPFNAEQLRRVRALLLEDPVLASGATPRPAPARSLWLPWIFLSFGLSVAVLLWIGWPLPAGAPMLWQGVASGFAAVDRLGPGARVQLLWAYDPATAGEMELVSAPVLAVTSAGADPPLRPFLNSGQLAGLISGYDGAYHYYELLGETPPAAVRSLRTQIAGQGYGALALLAIVVLGNLAALLTGRRHDG